MPMPPKKFVTIPAAGARKGLPVTYTVDVNGKEIVTGGFVQKAEKTGDNEITLTIEHYKTDEIFTNTLRDSRKIAVHMVALVNHGITGTLTLWPTIHDRQQVKVAAWAQWDTFKKSALGTTY